MSGQKTLWGRKLPCGVLVNMDDGLFDGYRANLDAPEGMVWSARGTHCVVVCKDDIDEVLRLGVEPCEDESCEYCN